MSYQVAYSYEENHDDDLTIVEHPHILTPLMNEWHSESLQWIGRTEEEKPYDPFYHKLHPVFRKPYFNPYVWVGPGWPHYEIRFKDDASIRVVDYNPEWPEIAKKEIEFIKSFLGDVVVAAEHIGSTAVPGMCARPTIDLMIAVREVNRDLINLIKSNGYTNIGTERTASREFFVKINPDDRFGNPLFHLHIAIYIENKTWRPGKSLLETPGSKTGDDYWNIRIWIRDLLRTNKDAFKHYMQFKKIATKDYPGDRMVYVMMKSNIVSQLMVLHRYPGLGYMYFSGPN